jgi:NADH:ubiquinone oxidoreductase subunit K
MANNPINLGLRFLLELAALFAMGYWGWTQHEGILRVLLAIGVPLIAAALWGTFRVDNDPKKAPVKVPGLVRLLLEIVFFAVGVGLLAAANQTTAAVVFGVIALFHYVISYDRILWLLKQ